MNFKDILTEKISIVDKELDNYLLIQKPSELYESMRYSVFSGGKRLRPLLAIATFELFQKDLSKILPFACAIELIHTYSLIHDDLPALDNDVLRRNKPTNHVAYGEALAILAGDGLLNTAFEIMAQTCYKNPTTENLNSMLNITKNAGTNGMIAGQVLDILSENKTISQEELNFIHQNKTGKLIASALLVGAFIGHANQKQEQTVSKIASTLGLAFQIKDDILDVTSTCEILGKTVNSDIKNNKTTFVSLYGLEKSIEKYDELTKSILSEIENLNCKNTFFEQIINHLLFRNK